MVFKSSLTAAIKFSVTASSAFVDHMTAWRRRTVQSFVYQHELRCLVRTDTVVVEENLLFVVLLAFHSGYLFSRMVDFGVSPPPPLHPYRAAVVDTDHFQTVRRR